jgi:hypothetical protein
MRLPLVVLLTTIRAASAASTQLTIGTGASLSLSHASLNLGCSDLVVTGTMNTDGQKRKVVGRQGLEPCSELALRSNLDRVLGSLHEEPLLDWGAAGDGADPIAVAV